MFVVCCEDGKYDDGDAVDSGEAGRGVEGSDKGFCELTPGTWIDIAVGLGEAALLEAGLLAAN